MIKWVIMKTLIFCIIFLFLLLSSFLPAQTIIPGGYVSGNWTENASPYIINGNLLVHPDSTLHVNAGTTILFTGPYLLEVQGQLLVSGTSQAPVTFDRENDTVAWRGIFINTTDTSITDSSILVHGTIAHCERSCLTLDHSGRVRISDFSFSHGVAFRGGGINCRFSSPRLERLIVENNQALDGGGIALESANATMVECTIRLNSADGAGGGMAIFSGSAPVIDHCSFVINYSFGSGGGIYVNDAFPAFVNCLFASNQGAQGGSNFYSGGAVSIKLDSEVRFENCHFPGNQSAGEGGAIAAFSPTTMVNCLFHGNSSLVSGGGVYLGSAGLMSSPINNCTFADNNSPAGSALANLNHKAILKNCILWHQSPANPGSLVYLEASAPRNVFQADYSDIQNGTQGIETGPNALFTWGQGNIDLDPGFEPESHTLNWNSPCIEAGTPDTTGLGLPQSDLAGNPRLVNERIDMGAYEYQLPVAVQSSKFKVQSGLQIYPVPSADFIRIEWDGEIENGKLCILDSSGKVVYEKQVESSEIRLNLADFRPGLYLIRINNDDGSWFRKIIKH